MRAEDERKIRTLIEEIRSISKELPSGRFRKISNRCDKITMVIRKSKSHGINKVQCTKGNPIRTS